ncbi:hypothetical protein EYZ11_010168 [Aspergillus tanneri]|uniref:Uncharacterized protein n=1 Tax=Aspergillus tanneri TaxID=1220188 RepID=A0A4S3J862_9EURO|nr:hypothetical protein EYZ11_010168 [Aspergillus tanneri]
MKYFKYAKSFNVFLSARTHGNRPSSLTVNSIGNPLDKESLRQVLQKATDRPALQGLKVWCSQPVVWRNDWNFQNLRYLAIKGLGFSQPSKLKGSLMKAFATV